MLYRRKLASLVSAGLLALIVGACSVQSAITDGVAEPPNVSATNTSPLDEFLGSSIRENSDETRRLANEAALRREELTAQCMQELGFTYFPDVGSGRFDYVGGIDERQPDDREWVSQYGFGIVSGHWRASGSNNQRVGDDPNQELVESLSDGERAAWMEALNGADPIFPTANMTPEQWAEFWRSRGCLGQSHQQATEESPLFLRDNDEFAPLFTALNELWNNVAQSPEFSALYRDWANCMADKGLVGYGRPADVMMALEDEYFDIQLWHAEGDNSVALQTFRSREVDLALTDLDCREAISFRGRRNTLFWQAEAQFVIDHRPQLEEYRNAAELAG